MRRLVLVSLARIRVVEESAIHVLLSEGSKFCAIRRMRTSFGRGAKLAQQERHTTCREERLREQHTGGASLDYVRCAHYARDDKELRSG
jgi:hypothetical protein